MSLKKLTLNTMDCVTHSWELMDPEFLSSLTSGYCSQGVSFGCWLTEER